MGETIISDAYNQIYQGICSLLMRIFIASLTITAGGFLVNCRQPMRINDPIRILIARYKLCSQLDPCFFQNHAPAPFGRGVAIWNDIQEPVDSHVIPQSAFRCCSQRITSLAMEVQR